jgi:uncharacterized protein (TIGR03437 family)
MQTQTVWFSPIAPAAWNNMIGSVDYLDLFAPGAAWTNASSRIQVFKMYPEMLSQTFPGSFSDATLQEIFSWLNSHNIALAVEFPPLTPTAACGMGVEGFGGQLALPTATRIQQLGGKVKYLAFDEPFYHGSTLYTGPNPCNWTPQQIAVNALQSVTQVRTVFPDVIVGDIEPVPGGPNWLSQYTAGIDAWQAAAGVPFAFFHFDVNWQIDWKPSVGSLIPALGQRGIPFGIIYNGWASDLSDAQWMSDAENHFAEWEAQGGAIPSHVIFQSWYAYPEHVLPESDPTALTYLIDSYFRQRTGLSLNISSSQASGSLANSEGAPIASAPITLTVQATTGSGTVANYVLSGTVPPSVAQAVIQVCVNECGDVGTNDMNVYSFQYSGSGQTSLNYANGLAGWTVDGNSTAVVQASSDAAGTSIRISATAAQHTYVNSSPFTILPGDSFTLTIRARVSPSSVGSGHFALVFLGAGGTEVSRDTLNFAPPTLTLGTAQTAGDGTYSIAFTPLNSGGFQAQAAYVGTNSLWTAFASTPASGTPSIPSNGIVNAADLEAEALPPGTWFSIFGQSLGTSAQWTNANTFTLGGAGVTVCGIPAAISYNSGPVITDGATNWQLNALTPDGVAGQTSCPVVVTVNGQEVAPVTVNIASGILELFNFQSSGGSLPVITHADYSPVGPVSTGLVPAQPGETLTAWGTGDCVSPTITVAGNAAPVLSSARVEAGLCQLNFSVPAGSGGNSQLKISTSPNAYTISVGRPE